jgi:hypothetical protein
MKIIKILVLPFFWVANCNAQVNEYTCMAPLNEWKFVLQLREDSTYKYEAFSKFGRWDLMLGKYEVKKDKLFLNPVSSEDWERLALSWGEEEKRLIMITKDTLANGEFVIKNTDQGKIDRTIPVSWNVASTRPSFFIIKNNRLYQSPVKKWPKTDPYYSRSDSSKFDFRKLFL